jgi:hypothetical protein
MATWHSKPEQGVKSLPFVVSFWNSSATLPLVDAKKSKNVLKDCHFKTNFLNHNMEYLLM